MRLYQPNTFLHGEGNKMLGGKPAEWVKIFVNYINGKGLLSRIRDSNSLIPESLLGHGQSSYRCFSGEDIQMPNKNRRKAEHH